MNVTGFNIGDLKINIPIIQGGMGIGISLGNLAGTVSKFGGLGVISVAQIGFKEQDFATNTINANLRVLKKEIEKAKSISGNLPVGVNIMRAIKNYADYVKAAVSYGADLIITGAGLPTELPNLVNEKIKIVPIVSSFKAMQILFKIWDSKYKKTADMIIVEGPEAGGHLGFKKELLENFNAKYEIDNIINHKKIYEEKYKKYIPVVFGGGIYSKEDFINSMSLGLDGVQIGTRFVTTYECDAHENFKQSYINSKKEDIIITNSPVGMPGRALNNNFIRNLTNEKITTCYKCLEKCNFKTTSYCITKALINSAIGDVDNGLIFCGSKAYKSNKLESVQDVLSDLIN